MNIIALLFLIASACAGGRHAPVPVPSPSPYPTRVEVTIDPARSELVTANIKSKVGNLPFAMDAIDALNEAYSSGCLERKAKAHTFKSLHSVLPTDPATPLEAYKRYVAGAPYSVELHWYRKWPSKVVGYTYNWASDTGGAAGESETRIWSNTRKMTTAKAYGAHLAHELSHQARAGGYVHYTTFSGSFPYDIGDIAAECMKEGSK